MKSKIAIVVAAAGLLAAGTAQASAELADKAGCSSATQPTQRNGTVLQGHFEEAEGHAEADIVAKLKSGKGHPEGNRLRRGPHRDREMDPRDVAASGRKMKAGASRLLFSTASRP
jgi:hypothetical protein